MTASIRIRDVLPEKILVSRESARLVVDPLRQAMAREPMPDESAVRDVAVDFDGIAGMAPSFLDEFLGVLESTVGRGARILFLAQPARLSLKFEAVARSRGLQVSQEDDGRWTLVARESAHPLKTMNGS